MLGREVSYQGNRAVVLAERCFNGLGNCLAIQFLDSNGNVCPMKNRSKGFRQYVYVAADKVIEGVDS